MGCVAKKQHRRRILVSILFTNTYGFVAKIRHSAGNEHKRVKCGLESGKTTIKVRYIYRKDGNFSVKLTLHVILQKFIGPRNKIK